jgi:DNA sulfur modification protein DndD
VSSDVRLAVAMKAKKMVTAYANDKKEGNTIHDISESATQRYRTWTTTAQTTIADRASALTVEMQQTELAQRDIERALIQAPADDAVAKVVQELTATTAEVSKFQQKIELAQQELQQFENQMAQAQRTLDKLLELNADQAALSKRMEIAERSITAMKAYQVGLTKTRISTLEDNISNRFRSLLRKDDLVSKVNVDPRSFNVTLTGQKGRSLKRNELSAGEKQIYAIATLWGLADTSGRPLPMVVDTPLGRLDSEHRSNLIHHYFPKVSHQVIILSTDTEVDEKLYDELSPYVGKAFLFESEEGHTTVKEEYFWQGGAA